MTIPFTQYFLPDGHTNAVAFDMEPEVEARASVLIKKGCHFDIEMLRTGEISMTCEKGEYVVSIVICENGAAVVESVCTLVDNATEDIDELMEESEEK